jgi:hypothetical protein
MVHKHVLALNEAVWRLLADGWTIEEITEQAEKSAKAWSMSYRHQRAT